MSDLRPATVDDALEKLTIAILRPMMKVLSAPEPEPLRKAALVEAVRLRLTEKVFRSLWERLDDIQQLAVSETLYSLEHRLDHRRFYAKYDALPEGIDWSRSGNAPLLHFFLYPPFSYRDLPTVIPKDLEQQLLKFVPRPPEPALTPVNEVPKFIARLRPDEVGEGRAPSFFRDTLTRRDLEQAAVHDLLTVLRLIDGGRITASAKTRRPSAVAVRRIAGTLHGGDFFDPTRKKNHAGQMVGPVRAFAWPWMVQAAKLVQLNGSKLALTRTGRAAFTAPPEETLRRIWERWLNSTLLDEFSRMEDIKGQFRGRGKRMMTPPTRRRAMIAEALAQCPVGGWVQVDDFFRFMRAKELHFSVTRDPWLLYVDDSERGSMGYAGRAMWNLLQGRYVRCLLFEYAATLGLVVVVFTDPRGARSDYWHMWGTDEMEFLSRYDGLEYFRLNPLGAYCLGLSDSYEPTTPPIRTALALFTDLRVQAAAPLPPEERLLLETFASPESDGVWRLDLSRALSAVESGQDVAQLREFLTARDDPPLPERIEGFIRSIELGGQALKSTGSALLIECASRKIADRIVADRRASKHCLRAGPRRLVVPERSKAAFRKAAHALGYAFPLQ